MNVARHHSSECPTYLDAPHTTYTYDLDSNRLTKAYGTITWTYAYDRTDELVSESTGGDPTAYLYDAYGNMTNKVAEGDNGALSSTLYVYDLAGRLTTITSGSSTATFTIDAREAVALTARARRR